MSDRVIWGKRGEMIPQKVRFRHKNYVVLENPVGIITKLCDCGYEARGFLELTNPSCPKCGAVYERGDR